MTDLIDRDAVEDIITNALNGYLTDDVRNTLEGIGIAISDIPSVDVVQCKDCKWYKTAYSWNGKEHKVCGIEPYGPIRKDDDFCSRGERKDE